MINAEETEIFGALLNELENINELINDVEIKNRIKSLIEQFDEVIL